MGRYADRTGTGIPVSKIVSKPKHKISTDVWNRPTDWISLPTPNVGEEKIVFIYQVTNTPINFCAFSIEGAYTVDWGDGTVENFATGVVAMHNFSWAAISSATLTSTGNRQVLVTITPQVGNNITSINFQRLYTGESTTIMKSRLIADIAISAPNCTSLRFGADPNGVMLTDTSMVASFPILQKFTWVGGIGAAPIGLGLFAYCYSLRSVTPPPTTGMLSAENMFYYCFSLVEAPYMDLSSCTSTKWMFYRCESLRIVPKYNTSSVTTFYQMFYYNNSLKKPPALDTSAGTIFYGMFYGSSSLEEIPSLNTSNGTDFGSMFYYNFNVKNFPYLNTSLGTNFNSMYEQCRSAKEFPVIDTSLGTNLGFMYASCYSLENAPAINTSSATNMASMFDTCYALKSVPTYSTANVTNMDSMFSFCFSLPSVPAFNTANVTDMDFFLEQCRSLREVPAFDMNKVTTASSMLATTNYASFTKVAFTGMGVSFSVAGANLTDTALNDIYTNVITLSTAKTITAATWTGSVSPYTYTYTTSVAHGFRVGQQITITGATPTVWNKTNFTITAVTTNTFSLSSTTLPTAWTSGGTATPSATITVTGCYGAATDNPAIANAKGWTVI